MSTVILVLLLGVVLLLWGLSRLHGHLGDWDAATWRRCRECGVLVRVNEEKELEKHLGHRLTVTAGVHVNEWLRICLGLL